MSKYVRLEVDIWYDVEEKVIKLASSDGKTFISTVHNKELYTPNSRRHAHLYNIFKRLLKQHNKWNGEE
jgi:hypothetical protein